AVSFGIAKALTSGVIDVYTIVINPIIEIVASLALGAFAGYLLSKLEQVFFSNTNRLSMTIGFVFLTVALSMVDIEVGKEVFLIVLARVMLGSVFCNMCILSEEIMKFADRWNAPVLVLFFVLAGAQLKLSVFTEATTVAIGVCYLISRSSGKYLGAKYSARAVKCSKGVENYLGITLLPQEGVALGMASVAAALPGSGVLIKNIVLFSVLVYELVGPLMTKWALKKAGEIVPKSKEILERRDNKIKEIKSR
ncbi:MAG: cation:proton antiporter, partial [Clostridia bacterium]|nr:cation:proton antiporter [Clostridia bacterium]